MCSASPQPLQQQERPPRAPAPPCAGRRPPLAPSPGRAGPAAHGAWKPARAALEAPPAPAGATPWQGPALLPPGPPTPLPFSASVRPHFPCGLGPLGGARMQPPLGSAGKQMSLLAAAASPGKAALERGPLRQALPSHRCLARGQRYAAAPGALRRAGVRSARTPSPPRRPLPGELRGAGTGQCQVCSLPRAGGSLWARSRGKAGVPGE